MNRHLCRRATSRLLLPAVALASTLAMTAGCGSSSGSGGTPSGSTTQITGQAIAGAVTGTVVVADGAGTTVASAAVTAGGFTVSVGDSALDGELDFVVTGSYTDEVSGEMVQLTAADPLALTTAAGHFVAGATGNAPITPGSTVVRRLVRDHTMTLTAARAAFQAAFGYAPDLDARPFDPTGTAPAAATGADEDEAFRAGVFSQLASDLGLTTGAAIAALFRGLADDLADGTLDGLAGAGQPVMVGTVDLATRHTENALCARLLTAHGEFVENTANGGGLAAPTSGLPALVYDGAGARRTVTTPGGRRVTVTLNTAAEPPFTAGFWTARVAHQITLTDADNHDAPIDITSDPTIVDVSHHPLMHMLSGHDHTTPHAHEPDTRGAAAGQYVLDAYYVMASEMGMGAMAMPMGVWDYTVRIDEDSNRDGTVDTTTEVIFHPKVDPPMGGAVLFAQVNHAADTWTSMDGTTGPRPYRVWLHEVVTNGDGSHDLTLFVSTQEMVDMAMAGMDHHAGMTFPAVYPGLTLHGPVDEMGMRPEVLIATVAVEVSTDGATWVALAEEEPSSGRYQVTHLAGLDNTAAGPDTLAVRLTVNGHSMQTAAGAESQLLFTAP
ncbi:MAG: hypothetical protein GW783_02780 [Deltaproteobacteria bacterium]|nr:hypothetical protein [Deltaproteobacteria bacterium]NCP96668.1 hypothetical protein [Deltaproteobacteria bacterium]NCS73041.1 hypothetical protein [Deltaproteobacteria bacterium]